MRSLSLDSLSVVDEDDFERPSRPSLSPSLSLTSLPSPAPVQRVVDLTTQVWTQANSKSLPITAGFFVKYTRVNNITNRVTSSVVCQTCQSRLHSDSKDTWIKHLKSAHNKNDTDTYARYITAEQTSRAVSGLSQPSTASFTASSPPKKQKAQHECQCGEGENGQKWIGCDGADCAIGWYHLSCVGLKRAPKGMWLCSDCNDEKDTDESDVD